MDQDATTPMSCAKDPTSVLTRNFGVTMLRNVKMELMKEIVVRDELRCQRFF